MQMCKDLVTISPRTPTQETQEKYWWTTLTHKQKPETSREGKMKKEITLERTVLYVSLKEKVKGNSNSRFKLKTLNQLSRISRWQSEWGKREENGEAQRVIRGFSLCVKYLVLKVILGHSLKLPEHWTIQPHFTGEPWCFIAVFLPPLFNSEKWENPGREAAWMKAPLCEWAAVRM